MINKTSNAIFNKLEINRVFELLTSVDNQLKTYFDNFLLEEYKYDFDERLHYVDIAEISRFIGDKIKSKQFFFLKEFFIKVEQILADCDAEVSNLIVLGLFESIQNTCGPEINYHADFNSWLLPISKTKWDDLIDSWEGTDWQNNNLKQL